MTRAGSEQRDRDGKDKRTETQDKDGKTYGEKDQRTGPVAPATRRFATATR